MKRMTREQKMAVHGGRSVAGIIQGVSAIVYMGSIVLGYVADYLIQEGTKDYRSREGKVFYNDIESKNIILS